VPGELRRMLVMGPFAPPTELDPRSRRVLYHTKCFKDTRDRDTKYLSRARREVPKARHAPVRDRAH